jgi:hypothetical protein
MFSMIQKDSIDPRRAAAVAPVVVAWLQALGWGEWSPALAFASFSMSMNGFVSVTSAFLCEL